MELTGWESAQRKRFLRAEAEEASLMLKAREAKTRGEAKEVLQQWDAVQRSGAVAPSETFSR